MNARTMAGIAMIVFASALLGLGVHHLLEAGNCSTTGYTQFGPAPKCSSSSAAWGIALPIATFLAIMGGVLGAPNIFTLLGPMFLAIGVGALTVHSVAHVGPGEGFILVFGGCFALAGAGLLAVPAWSALKAVRDGEAGLPSRIVRGVGAVAAGLAVAFGVASLLPSDHPTGGTANAADVVPNPTGASFPQISATDPASLYRTANFKRALVIAGAYVGADADVRSLRLVPGGVDISVALGDRRAKDISIDSSGGYLSAAVVRLPEDPPSFPMRALVASTPVKLEERLAGRVDHMTAAPGGAGSVNWSAYPVGGGVPATLTDR